VLALLYSPVLPSSILALGTTVHLALSALRHHRRPGPGAFSALTFISLALALTPWLFPGAAGLVLGLAAHAAWYAACERYAPPRPPAAAPAAARPAAVAERRVTPERRTGVDRRATGFVQVPVLTVFEETADIRTFRMARPDGFDFVAGQFLPVRVKVDGKDHVRCYSISSSPAARGYLEISVKRQGLVSGTLHTIARPGTLLSVRSPGGSFTYPSGDDRPLVLLAGGIGITPLLSMLRHAVEAEPSRRVTLLYSAPTEDAFAFRDDIRALLRRHPHARAYFAVTKGPGGPDFYAGRIDKALIRATVPDVTAAIALLCGPQPMIDGLRELLASLGMPAAQIRSERFEAAVASTGGPQAGAAVATEARPTGDHDVTCVRSQTAVRAGAGQTLLEAAEAGGVPIDSLCRSGVCGTCRTKVIEGDVACDATLLDDADRASGHVLACVARVHSDCVVEL
jgi:ferredoxin-NADP reductase